MSIELELERWTLLANNWPAVVDHLNKLIADDTQRLLRPNDTPTLEDVRIFQEKIELYRSLIVLPERRLTDLRKKVTPNAR